MSELRSIVEAARDLRARGESPLLATVVDVRGSSYRKPGARMIFSEERWLAGSISAGCLERDVVAKGAFRTRGGRAQVVTYDALHDERVGTGCDGIIDVLVERTVGTSLCDPLHLIEHCLANETRAVLLTVFRSENADVSVGSRLARLASGDQGCTLEAGPLVGALEREAARVLAEVAGPARVVRMRDVEVLVEHITPPPHLFVFGTMPDAVPVVQLARTVGFSVTVCEERAQLTTRERFREADRHLIAPVADCVAALTRCARPAAVTMAHHYDRDLAALEQLVRTNVGYIGLLGSRARSARLLDDLAARGHHIDEALRRRIHAPVGLPIGAESPREIALAIVAEVQAALAVPRMRAASDAVDAA
ncbi:MAG: XdhC family protein [Polyangiales bacterium]